MVAGVFRAIRAGHGPDVFGARRPPLDRGDLSQGFASSGREADAQAVTEAASTACATLPTWVISTLWGLACSATGMVIVSTPS